MARVCTQSTAVPPRPPCNYCSELTGELAEAKVELAETNVELAEAKVRSL